MVPMGFGQLPWGCRVASRSPRACIEPFLLSVRDLAGLCASTFPASRTRTRGVPAVKRGRRTSFRVIRRASTRSLIMTASLRPYDEALLRLAFDVAKRSRAGGDHPFGSVLADSGGRHLMEQGNGYLSEGRDRTAHAERLLASRAARTYDLAFLSGCTLFTSAEPCAMCAG